MRGYAGKYLDIDLSKEKIDEVNFDEDILRQYIGGRGLASRILWDRLGDRWETIDPLGPENLLLFLTGPLTGYYPGARTCVSGKSPQSNGITGSTISSEFPIDLRCSGYDGVIVTGKASNPVYIFINDSKVEIRDASHIWGKKAKETIKTLTNDLIEELEKANPRSREWREPSSLYVGPAGENSSRAAAVCGKLTHGAGYGGYGGVMGSKNLKAVVAKGTGPLPEVDDMVKVKTLIDKVCNIRFKDDAFRRWGTGYAGYSVGAEMSSEPIRNWQEEWHDEKGFGIDKFENRVWVKKYWGDFGCPTTCLKVAFVRSGPFKGSLNDNPDYEAQAYLGTNLGLFTPEENVHMSGLIDELGFCSIQGGNVLGFAAELFQRGILTKDDFGGIEPKWGDAAAFASLAEMIAKREGIGNVFAEGSYRAALKIKEITGKDVMQYVIHNKGVAIGAHGTRSGKDFVLNYGYPCSVQGGDHTSAAALPFEGAFSEASVVFWDSAVSCWFNAFGVPMNIVWDFYEAVTGWKITNRLWFTNLARRIMHIQRAALLLGGPDVTWNPKVDDDNPPRWYEPLPSGPYKGQTTDKADFLKNKLEYFKKMGWTKLGRPKAGELKRLGLEDVGKDLKRIK